MGRNQELAGAAVDYALRFIGTPYRWGGDDPMAGFDCSGLVVEVLQGVGVLNHRADYTADGLRRKFPAVKEPKPGCLACFGAGPVATHVGMIVDVADGVPLMLEAGGGGSKTKTLNDAITQNAYVMLRPVARRMSDFLGYVDPFGV